MTVMPRIRSVVVPCLHHRNVIVVVVDMIPKVKLPLHHHHGPRVNLLLPHDDVDGMILSLPKATIMAMTMITNQPLVRRLEIIDVGATIPMMMTMTTVIMILIIAITIADPL
jgi:hypothetical protein